MPATPMASYMIAMGFDINQQQFNIFNAASKQTESSFKTLQSSLLRLASTVGITGAAIVTGVTHIVEKWTELYYASQFTGVTVANLVAFSYGARQAGISAEESSKSLSSFVLAMNNPGFKAKFEGLTHFNYDVEHADKSLMELAKTIMAMPPWMREGQAALYGQNLETLSRLAKNQKLVNEAEEHNIALMKAAGVSAKELSDNAAEMDRGFAHLTDTLWKLGAVWANNAAFHWGMGEGHMDRANARLETLLIASNKGGFFTKKFWSDFWSGAAQVPPNAAGAGAATGAATVPRVDVPIPPVAAPMAAAPAGSITGGSRLSIANNNPGNLRFAGQAFATQGEGGFARFDTMQHGIEALNRQIQHRASQGMDIRHFITGSDDKKIGGYAPSSENNSEEYIAQMAAALKVPANTKLSDLPTDAVARFVANKESGTRLPLGGAPAGAAGKTVNLTQNTTINATGPDPHTTGKIVYDATSRVAQDLAAVMKGNLQ